MNLCYMNIEYDDAKIIKGFGHCVEQEKIWKSLQHLTFNMVSFLLVSFLLASFLFFLVSFLLCLFLLCFFFHVNIPYLLIDAALSPSACPFILLLTKHLNTDYRMFYISKMAWFVLINRKMPVLKLYITLHWKNML